MSDQNPRLMASELLGWTRGRVVFLAISATILVGLLLLVREVLLPFVLGSILAYILMPLVAWAERKLRLGRGLAIILVYVAVLGSLGLLLSLGAPRLYSEAVRLGRELPAQLHSSADRHGASLDAWVNRTLPSRPGMHAQHEPAFVARTLDDGRVEVEVKKGLIVMQEGEDRWRLAPREELPPGGFHVAQLMGQGVDRFVRYVEMNAVEVLKLGRAILSSISKAIFMFFMVMMVAGYLMHTSEQVMGFFRSLVPPLHRPAWELLLRRVDRGLSGVIRGQLLICLVNGLLSAVGFWFFDLKYWPIMALLAAGLSIIPIFGAILSSVPAVLIGLTQDLGTAVAVLLWIIGIHQVEANLLNPKIIGVAAKIHPVLVVFSLLAGEHYFGLWGALLAVPALSLLQSLFNHFRFASLPDASPDSICEAGLGASPSNSSAPTAPATH